MGCLKKTFEILNLRFFDENYFYRKLKCNKVFDISWTFFRKNPKPQFQGSLWPPTLRWFVFAILYIFLLSIFLSVNILMEFFNRNVIPLNLMLVKKKKKNCEAFLLACHPSKCRSERSRNHKVINRQHHHYSHPRREISWTLTNL
jgi:hypothetical protein